MIQAESPLGHHLFQVPIAERISQIPTNAQHDDLVLKVSPPKQCWPLVLHSLTLPECIQPICDRTLSFGSANSSRTHRPVNMIFRAHAACPDDPGWPRRFVLSLWQLVALCRISP